MTNVITGRGRGDRLLLWCACILTLAAGVAIGYYRLQVAIDGQHELAANIASVARADDRIIAGRTELERTERRLDQSMSELGLQADHPTAVARLIRELSRLATIHDTTLIAIDEGRLDAMEQHTAPPVHQADLLEAIPLDVSLSGSYRNLLATISDLGRAPIALQIQIVAIERTGVAIDATSAAPLTARLHIGIEHLRDPIVRAPLPPSSPQGSFDARSR